jgi:two-component system, NtrC family, response regulator PilR
MAEKLLIVEDEDTLRESLKRVLLHEGYTVDCVDSCESAFDSLECKSYDLIISDIILPGVDGLDLLRRCKGLHPNLIVIIITAYASIETAVKAMKIGAYDYLVKPINHVELKALVRKALDERSSEKI